MRGIYHEVIKLYEKYKKKKLHDEETIWWEY